MAQSHQQVPMALEIGSYTGKLLDLRRSRDLLMKYDLIIIAIGAPTQERLFHDYLIKEKINVPVINTWVEGYGIGGMPFWRSLEQKDVYVVHMLTRLIFQED